MFDQLNTRDYQNNKLKKNKRLQWKKKDEPQKKKSNLIYFLINSTGGSSFISEPYYREYFAPDTQGYAPTRTIYNDSDGPQTAATYEGRFTSHSKGPVYAKTVTAAGLTVDLPSPDSGIGADAITPRDQNNIQQVS